VIGFYLQPGGGGRVLPYSFWRRFMEIENVIAIKMAPFNRYQTIDVVRAVIEARRDDIALHSGNDDNIVIDMLLRWQFERHGYKVQREIVGSLPKAWAV
jgi:dihydrodipicolinate synthase/N-acetylneuraminate lyase